MVVSARLKTNSAYVLQPDDVQKLWTLLEDKIGAVKATALCADDIERGFASSSDLVGYTNFQAQKIQTLEFSARSGDRESTARIRFAQRYAPYIEMDADGEETAISSLKQHVANLCQAIKPWYSGISKINFFYVVISILILVVIVLGEMAGGGPAKPLSFRIAVLTMLVLIAVLAMFAGLAWALNFIRASFFPISTFAIGAEERRYRFNENVRWVVFVGFFVSLAAAIVFALLWR